MVKIVVMDYQKLYISLEYFTSYIANILNVSSYERILLKQLECFEEFGIN